MTEPRVEAGGRAVETARSVDETYMAQGSTLNPSDARIEYVASVIQCAMNAQEREWKEVLRQCASMVEAIRWGAFRDAPSNLELRIERLLAERGEGR